MPHRLFIAKRAEFTHLTALASRLSHQLSLPELNAVRSVVIYDVHNCPESLLDTAISKVFADPVSDEVIDELPAGDFCFVVEPLPEADPLWTLEGAHISPHMSGDVTGWRDTLSEQFRRHLRTWLSGGDPGPAVDKGRGYVSG